MLLKKHENNPILKPNPDNAWESLCVLNPAVIYDDEREEFVMIYRCAGHDKRHEIKMGLATSKDGINFTRQCDEPVFYSLPNEADGGCVEDPRLAKIGDLYYLTYAARAYAPGQYWLDVWEEGVSRAPMYLEQGIDVHGNELPKLGKENITVSYLAITKDFKNFKKLGRLTEATVDDRDVVIFPERIGGKYVIISRPKFKNVPEIKMPSIWISFTDDLLEYSKPELLMTGETDWEVQRIGAGTTPIKTERGWFMIYHGVDAKGIYRNGAVLLDLEDPRKIIARTKDYIMEPDQAFEFEGFYEGCVFPTGTVVKDNTLYVYYGCADKYIGLATCEFDKLINYLYEECKIEE